MSAWYRPFVYSKNINDYGFADIGNNIAFVPGVYFVLLLIRQRFLLGRTKDIFLHLIILITIEFTSGLISGIGTFDLKDILGLAIGAGITYAIMINKR